MIAVHGCHQCANTVAVAALCYYPAEVQIADRQSVCPIVYHSICPPRPDAVFVVTGEQGTGSTPQNGKKRAPEAQLTIMPMRQTKVRQLDTVMMHAGGSDATEHTNVRLG